jgi:hypothetical protein
MKENPMKIVKTAQNKPQASALDLPAGEPTREEIAAVAYSIWEQEGWPDGRDVENWLKAEAQIRQHRNLPALAASAAPKKTIIKQTANRQTS